MVFAPKHKEFMLKQICLNLGEHVIHPAQNIRNLGVIYDVSMCFEDHVNRLCRSCYCELRNISRVRRYLTDDAAKSLVHSLVISKLDYCNVLLFGSSEKLLTRLQHVQNLCARIVTRTPKRDHITPALVSLHWLPVRARILYKLLLYVYKALNNLAPVYLSDLLCLQTGGRQLRSNETQFLRVPLAKTVKYGDHAFTRAAPLAWNSLPVSTRTSPSIGSFKKSLKTYLFQKFYEL